MLLKLASGKATRAVGKINNPQVVALFILYKTVLCI